MIEAKTLKQILDESGIDYKFKGWSGSSQLILSQKYVPKVFFDIEKRHVKNDEIIEVAFAEKLKEANIIIKGLDDIKAGLINYNNSLETQIEEAKNTLKQAKDFLETIDDDKLSANHVLNLISTLEEELSPLPNKKVTNE